MIVKVESNLKEFKMCHYCHDEEWTTSLLFDFGLQLKLCDNCTQLRNGATSILTWVNILSKKDIPLEYMLTDEAFFENLMKAIQVADNIYAKQVEEAEKVHDTSLYNTPGEISKHNGSCAQDCTECKKELDLYEGDMETYILVSAQNFYQSQQPKGVN